MTDSGRRTPHEDGQIAEEALGPPEVSAESIVETIHEPLLVLTPELRVKSVNPAFYEHFGVRPEQTLGRRIYELGNGDWDIPGLRTLLEEVLPDSHVFNDFEVRHDFAGLGRRVMLVNARRLNHVKLILLGIRDITGQKRAEEALHELNQALERRVEERTREMGDVLRQLIAAEEDERRRISRELHDQMGQQLTGLMLGLRAARQEVDAPELVERLRSLERLAGETARDMQSMAVQLRPPALDTLGLVGALEGHLADRSRRHGLEHDFHAGGMAGVRLSFDVETTLYRVVQEGLTNVLKHAQATRVGLLLDHREGMAHAILEDNGCGFDVEETLARPEKAKRLGVRGMRERVTLLGGELQFESSPGNGTTLYVRVPASATEPAASARRPADA